MQVLHDLKETPQQKSLSVVVESPNKKIFLNYIHSFRGLAILQIVIGHCLVGLFDWNAHVGLGRLFQIVFLNGTFLFVFIAGYLFQHLSYKYEFKNYLRGKLLFVGLPYLIISIPAIFFRLITKYGEGLTPEFFEHSFITQVIIFLVTGAHLTPLWFIPMIFLFYFLSPLLISLDRNGKVYWLLPVFILISCYVSRGNVLISFVYFISVYLLGMFSCKYHEKIVPVLSETSTLITTAILIITCILLQFEYTSSLFDPLNYFQKLFLCSFSIGFLNRNRGFARQTLAVLASTSFGVFFVHFYFVALLRFVSLRTTGEYFQFTLLKFIALTISVIAISMSVVLLVQKLLGRKSRLLIGS